MLRVVEFWIPEESSGEGTDYQFRSAGSALVPRRGVYPTPPGR
ncbi:MAG TPA: hypothetical protein VFQ52_04885 [Rhizomicrobium sp.]|nr:hypothetical protein [Rhizomicrobium sp.]